MATMAYHEAEKNCEHHFRQPHVFSPLARRLARLGGRGGHPGGRRLLRHVARTKNRCRVTVATSMIPLDNDV